MKKLIIKAMVFFLSGCSVIAQSDTLWTKTYGGQYSDGGRSIIEAIDGGFVIAGYTYSFGEGYADFYLVKTDSEGNEEWAKTYGGPNMDYAYDVCKSVENDGYVLVGYTASYGNGSKDIYMVKTDIDGNEIWTQTFGGPEVEHAKSIIPTNDGNYLICGYTESFGAGEDDIYLINTDPEGNLLWEKTIGTDHSEMGEDIIETSDGNFLITGSSGLYDIPGNNSGRNRDIYLVKTDQSGNVLEEGYYWIMLGNQGAFDDGYAVCENSDGEYYIVGGCTRESVEVLDIAVVKTDSELNVIWKENLEMGESAFYDFSRAALKPTSDGGILICGSFKYASTIKNDLFVIKVDSTGNEEWSGYYGGDGSESAYAITESNDEGFVITGHTSSYGAGSFDVWLLKLDLNQTGLSNEPKSSEINFQIFPNPAIKNVTISYELESATHLNISITDSSGKLIKALLDNKQAAGEYHHIWDGKGDSGREVPAGVYLCKIQAGKEVYNKKIILSNK